MSPVVIKNIAGVASEEYLVTEHRPGCPGVAREADGVTMRAESTPAVIDDGAQFGTVLLHVLEEGVVAPEGLAQVLRARSWRVVLFRSVFAYGECLLPVEPPEVNALILVRPDDILEQGFHVFVVLHLPK